MTVAIECLECGSDVPFWLEGEEKHPVASCDECGAVYELGVKQIKGPNND